MRKLTIISFYLLLNLCFARSNAFASKGQTVNAGSDVTVANDYVFDEIKTGDTFHCGFLFESSDSVYNETNITFKENFLFEGKVNCNGEHNIYGFKIGETNAGGDKTGLNFKGNSVKIEFGETFGYNIYGLQFANVSHDDANPLTNSVDIDELSISLFNDVKAKNYASAIMVQSLKKSGDTQGTSNIFKGGSLNLAVENNYDKTEGEAAKAYAAGIFSQGDILATHFDYDTINIQTSGRGKNTSSYGIYAQAANGKTQFSDLHVVDVFAKNISVNSVAEEYHTSPFGYGAGIRITGNNPSRGPGRTAVDVGVQRDWSIAESDFEGSIEKLAENVSIHGSGNAVYAEMPNTWVTIGAAGSIQLTSDAKSTVFADSGARVIIFGNSYVRTNGEKIRASALFARNYYLNYSLTENPESRIWLYKGNHTVIGDIVALDGGAVNINPGTHFITGDIYSQGILEQTGPYTGVYDAIVNIANEGGYFEGKADTFYKYDEGVTYRIVEKSIMADSATGDFYPDLTHGIINLSFSDNAEWRMTDRSFVTSLSLKDSSVHLNHGRNYAASDDGGRGLFIEKLDLSDGKSGFFNMTLNGTDKTKSDMLYIKEGIGSGNADYQINIDMMNSDLSALNDGKNIRYATVKGTNLKDALAHKAVSFGSGIYNIEFETGYAEYDKADPENKDYNGDSSSDLHKPGNKFVDDEFGTDSYNLFLKKAARGGAGTFSRAARSIFDLSRFGYLQIIQPDRLNKRVGDVFNLGSEEDGFWFRTNYDNLGVEGIRSESIAMQGGYDKLYQHDDFSFRYGLSGRYTKSDLRFAAFGGYGEIQATQLSLYGTYVSQNDWFLDVTGRYGYIANESHLKTESGFDFASSYDNWFQGLSVEAGRRFYLHKGDVHDFYFAPQALLTYLHINEVDYTTNQGSRIAVSGINSVITRLGAKLGYVYDDIYQAAVKWDWFREWKGEQHFSMQDKTTGAVPAVYDMGTDVSWYDVGLTLQANPNENLAVYIDAERLYGGFYQNSWRFSAGVRITF